MNLQSAAKRIARQLVESRGYYIRHSSVLTYGINYMTDIARIARLTGAEIRVFFDVGASIGYTSAPALSAFPKARVIAFEPHPSTFAELTANIGRHERFEAHNVAVSEVNGQARLFCNGGSRDSFVFADDGAQSLTVDCVTIDSFCRRSGVTAIDVLKTDAEGFDLSVLRGASDMLTSGGVKFVLTEFFQFDREGKGTSLTQVADLLLPLGFSFVATYSDNVVIEHERLFVCANVLFAKI
jgi:FkbM family methyltransferase